MMGLLGCNLIVSRGRPVFMNCSDHFGIFFSPPLRKLSKGECDLWQQQHWYHWKAYKTQNFGSHPDVLNMTLYFHKSAEDLYTY